MLGAASAGSAGVPARASATAAPDILVVGLGNPLMGDDGVGARVVALLSRRPVRAAIRLVTADDCLALLTLWRGESHVWLVDAATSLPAPTDAVDCAGPAKPQSAPGCGVPPGTIHLVEHDALLALPPHRQSAHHLSLAEALRWLLIAAPDMERIRWQLWGVEAQSVAVCSELAPVLAAAVEPLAAAIEAAAVDFSST